MIQKYHLRTIMAAAIVFCGTLCMMASETENIYPRKFVVEEWTGTWCGSCPRGLVAFEYMNEKYGDANFIGLSVHADDRMEPPSYRDWIAKFTTYSSYPGCAINRYYIADPERYNLERKYKEVLSTLTYAKVEASAVMPSKGASTIDVTAKVILSRAQEDADLRISFVLTENGVGPYLQYNTYSGGLLGEMGGWENKSNRVSCYYDDVVRETNASFGAEGSLPSMLEADTEYTYTATLSLQNIEDIDKCHLVALLIDGDNGEIVNADKIGLYSNGELEESGNAVIERDIESNNDVYTLQGVCVKKDATLEDLQALPRGIYIVGGEKVVRY